MSIAALTQSAFPKTETPPQFQLVFVDTNNKVVDTKIVTAVANKNLGWQRLEIEYELPSVGKAYISCINQGAQSAFFDDVDVCFYPSLQKAERHYFPFGLEIEPLSKSMKPIYPFTYTGKELVNTDQFLEHDFGARWYDPTLGRFTSVDPLSAKFHSLRELPPFYKKFSQKYIIAV